MWQLRNLFILLFLGLSWPVLSQDVDSLELLDPTDGIELEGASGNEASSSSASSATTSDSDENFDDFFKDEAETTQAEQVKTAPESKSDKDSQIVESENVEDFNLSDLEEIDDLDSLKSDIGEALLEEEKKREESPAIEQVNQANEDEARPKATEAKEMMAQEDDFGAEPQIIIDQKAKVVNEPQFIEAKVAENISTKKAEIFDVGNEEKRLLEVAAFLEGKIPENEWDEIATATKVDKYVVQKGDWLWKISKNLFGSGFYYSKIWSMNPHIVNPHEIEPGMVLVFDTGSEERLPGVKLGQFTDGPSSDGAVDLIGGASSGSSLALSQEEKEKAAKDFFEFREYGESVKPPWIEERKKLIDQGVYFQYASETTYDDLVALSKIDLEAEYQDYEPPATEIIVEEPPVTEYDRDGFDRNAKISFEVKEGFFLNTFVTSNVVQDLGLIDSLQHEAMFIRKFDKIYVKFDEAVKVKPGDQFSIYKAHGKVTHLVSERVGFRYSVLAQIKVVKKINSVWESHVTDLSGIIERGDRVTLYTPKINRIRQTFNKRNIEAVIIESNRVGAQEMGFGEVVYIDRGRADGVELGNVFELYDFIDRGTGRRISTDPTYKIGEVTVITLSDNFSTALISLSSDSIKIGTIALTKTAEKALQEQRLKQQGALAQIKSLEQEALDELDVELNLDDVGEDLLNQADKIKLTEDELEELERQEREKSVIKDQERDLRELERLEREIIESENRLNEAKVDEDKFLEQQNLNSIESQTKDPDKDAFESLNEIEGEFGRKYLDEDLNSKDNPYGLTEFDLEEIDELLNTEAQ